VPEPHIAREFVAAFNDRDLDGMLRLVDDEIEIVPIRAAVEDIVYRGRDGLEQWMRDIDESWSELQIEIDQIDDPAPDRQIVLGRLVGRGVESAAPVEMNVRWVAQLNDGRLTRIDSVIDR
jgi:ketosteroid isomerase-like protein